MRARVLATVLAGALIAWLPASDAAARVGDVRKTTILLADGSTLLEVRMVRRGYSVRLWSNGDVEYNGVGNVASKGCHLARIHPARLARIGAAIDRAGFQSLLASYTTIKHENGMVDIFDDMPECDVTIRTSTWQKTVDDYVGSPSGLSELRTAIDSVARTSRWIRGRGRRDP